MRKQYFFRLSPRGSFAWDVDRLVGVSAAIPRRCVRITDISELDESCCIEAPGRHLTYRDIAKEVQLKQEADLRYPIILSADMRVMDGMHRVMKALNAGIEVIEAVHFEKNPGPDYVDVRPEDLQY